MLTLSTGLISVVDTSGQVQINPFNLKHEESVYLSDVEKRIIEADSVTTVAYIYSENLGSDAGVMTDELYSKASVVAGEADYLSSMPIINTSTDQTQRNKIIEYVVANGDTLSGIAAKFNISTDTIRYANKITDVDSLKPGTNLTILPITGVLHTVESGDTLAGIASRYKSTEALIIAQNDLYGEEIKVGLKLLIPDGEIPEAPKPAQTQPTTQSRSTGSQGSSTPTRGSGSYRFPTLIGRSGYFNGYHNWAIDIPNSIGTPIFAADSGRIVEAKYGYNGGYGNTILIDHGNGTKTRYAHMIKLNIIGGYVSKGQVIGQMGSTGRSTGPHLHFEIIIGGVRVNPIYYF